MKKTILSILMISIMIIGFGQSTKKYYHNIDAIYGLSIGQTPKQKGTGPLTIDENGNVGSNPCVTDSTIYLKAIGFGIPDSTIYFRATGCFYVDSINEYTVKLSVTITMTINNFANVFSGGAEPVDTTVQDSEIMAMYFISDLDTMQALGIASPQTVLTISDRNENYPSSIEMTAEEINISDGGNMAVIMQQGGLYFYGFDQGNGIGNALIGIDADNRLFYDTTDYSAGGRNIYDYDGFINADRTVSVNNTKALNFDGAKSFRTSPVGGTFSHNIADRGLELSFASNFNYRFLDNGFRLLSNNSRGLNMMINGLGYEELYQTIPMHLLFKRDVVGPAIDTLVLNRSESGVLLDCSLFIGNLDTLYVGLLDSISFGAIFKVGIAYESGCVFTMPSVIGFYVHNETGLIGGQVNGANTFYSDVCDYSIFDIIVLDGYETPKYLIEPKKCP